MSIKKVFIMGSGLMGAGIAQVCAQAGLSVTICDVNAQVMEKAKKKNIEWSVSKLVEKGKGDRDRRDDSQTHRGDQRRRRLWALTLLSKQFSKIWK